MKAWFLSDIHLKSVNERNGVILLRFLRSLAEDKATTHLFLLGDIFDVWVGDSAHFVDQFAPFIEELDRLKRRGVQVVYFEGNHDFHIEGFWKEAFGAEVYNEPHYFQLGSMSVRCEHGDYINPDDKAYLRYRHFMRTPLMKRVALALPGIIVEGLGTLASRKSRSISEKSYVQNDDSLRQMIRAYTKRAYEQSEHFDIFIAGHIHVRDEVKVDVDGHKVQSVNLGSWLEKPAVYCLEKNSGQFVDLA